MATSKQIEANQRNASKSSGSKTKQGKSRTSMNAMKHGILSSKVLLTNEDPSEFKVFTEQTFMALQPTGDIETLLADRIISIAWRLRRAIVVEGSLFEKDPLAFIGPDTVGDTFRKQAEFFSVLSRYETGLERSLYRALHELQRVQALRKGMTTALPVAIDIHSFTDDRQNE